MAVAVDSGVLVAVSVAWFAADGMDVDVGIVVDVGVVVTVGESVSLGGMVVVGLTVGSTTTMPTGVGATTAVSGRETRRKTASPIMVSSKTRNGPRQRFTWPFGTVGTIGNRTTLCHTSICGCFSCM